MVVDPGRRTRGTFRAGTPLEGAPPLCTFPKTHLGHGPPQSAQPHPSTDFSLVWAAAECLESWASSVCGSERRAYLSLPETPAQGLATALPGLRPRAAPPR